MFSKIRDLTNLILSDPVEAGYFLYSKIAPSHLTARYVELCSKAGIVEPSFILSFDCDTKKDVQVLPKVHERLRAMGIHPVYAVPGALIEYGADVYTKFAEDGSEFINHGYAEHCHLLDDDITYESSFFYDQLSNEVIEEDILKGHQALKDILGVFAKGFRTPHFGTYQTHTQLNRLHNILESLNYDFSTSTVPVQGIKYGPATKVFGLPEFPMTGCPSKPLRILDSWSFRFAPGRKDSEATYLTHLDEMSKIMKTGAPYLVNLYVDPSQVYDWEDFFTAIEKFAAYNIESYSSLLEKMN